MKLWWRLIDTKSYVVSSLLSNNVIGEMTMGLVVCVFRSCFPGYVVINLLHFLNAEMKTTNDRVRSEVFSRPVAVYRPHNVRDHGGSHTLDTASSLVWCGVRCVLVSA